MLCFLFLRTRATQLQELADAPDCNRELLYNTYAHFKTLNKVVSSWRSIYERYIFPLLNKEKTLSVLDIGCGGGDITLALAKWAQQDNLTLEITAIDTDSRAINFVQSLDNPYHIKFRHASTKELIAQNQSFDLVISNHLMHHLSNSEMREILVDVKQLGKKLIVFNDIERSIFAYLGFVTAGILLKPFFSNSFLWIDGLRSIQRSYSKQELRAIAPANWQVKRQFLFRLLLIHSQ